MKPQKLLKLAILTLWLGWLALLPGTFIAIVVTGQSQWNRFWWMSSVLLSLAAWTNGFLCRRSGLGLFAVLIAVGMSFGTLADIYGAFSVIRFTEPLAMIIPLFSLGPFAYIGGMLSVPNRLRLSQRSLWKKTLGAFIALYSLMGLGLWMVLVYPSNDLPHMHWPVAFYTLVLSGAAAVMATVACLDRRFLVVGTGGVLFFVSDAFLAVRLFQNNWHNIGDLCWITYGIGQMLIVYGAIWSSSCDNSVSASWRTQ